MSLLFYLFWSRRSEKCMLTYLTMKVGVSFPLMVFFLCVLKEIRCTQAVLFSFW